MQPILLRSRQKKVVPMIVVSDDQFTALKPGEAPLVLGGRGPRRGARPNFEIWEQTYAYHESPGTARDRLTSRSGLNDFAPRLFTSVGN